MRTHKELNSDENHTCNSCCRIFRDKSNLIHHMRMHTGSKKKLSCNECGKTFRDKSTLKTHMAMHTGEEVYACKKCGKTYKWRSSCNKHQKESHWKIKYFMKLDDLACPTFFLVNLDKNEKNLCCEHGCYDLIGQYHLLCNFLKNVECSKFI